ncbi:putative integral membrane protein [Streptantibioticus cattleyicolor NRRL 8057 = DSM 46488]|uniref:Putative integral membrane protein n=3 Tax=Streptomycetaceae TaxID=2062 RepID=F8JWP7_STREN|nr:putative integral membrane protein [Streptantibioticus cattleyicolor NRRL 8057 = DSM 46488]MYS61510.1 thioredoxin domain-containing protein [Streptomyces sp. SID5468]CCB77370.1 Putative integral membrane protein (modular protein) [Streptantibioticus cattleyicolor NRRL 8057 = DSM 46488]
MGREMAQSKGAQGTQAQGEPAASGTAGARHPGRRWRPYTAAVVAVAAVFAGSAAIGAHVRSGKTTAFKAPSGLPSAGPESLAIPVRPTVPVTLTVYEDLRSRASRDFARAYAPTFDALLRSGQVQLAYRLVTQSDTEHGGTGSAQAANAAACAQDQGKDQFRDYVAELWRKQPDPSSDKFASGAYLIRLAKKVKGIQEAEFTPCVQERDHQGWVRRSQQQFAAAHLGDVPVVDVNGRTYSVTGDKLTPAKLRKLVAAAVKQAQGTTPSAAPSPSASGQRAAG